MSYQLETDKKWCCWERAAQLNGPHRARESQISKFWAEKLFRGSENHKSGFEGLISYCGGFLLAVGTVQGYKGIRVQGYKGIRV